MTHSLNEYRWGPCAVNKPPMMCQRNWAGLSRARFTCDPLQHQAREITLVLREGYDPELLNQGFRTMITQLNLELLFIDTYPGVNEETLLWIVISEIENTMHEASMNIEFTGKIWYWRGPAPFYFVTVPAEGSGDIKAISNLVTYGWGVIPVHARIGETEWQTSLFPKDGLYLVPLKDAIRKAEKLVEGDDVTIRLEIRW